MGTSVHCAVEDETFFYNLLAGETAAQRLITPATYSFAQFKNDLEDALVSYLGRAAAVPLFEHRSYVAGSGHVAGVALMPDKKANQVHRLSILAEDVDPSLAKREARLRGFW